MTATETVSFEIEDFTGQVRRRARNVPKDATVGEMISSVGYTLALPDVDAQGQPVIYGARNSHGEALNGSDRVGDVIAENEVVSLTKTVTAG